MGLRLYQGEPRFRDVVDRCAATLSPELGGDVRQFLFPEPADAERARESLNNTKYTQPAIFVTSYALATMFQHWGIAPSAFVGHSIGEFVAATLGGVMEVDDALRLVATRGRLMQSLPSGSMLSVRLPEEVLASRLPAGVDMAAVNGPQLCVVAGPTSLVTALNETLTAEGVACRILHTSHAFHSSMMDPVVEPFLRVVEGVRLSAPRIPFVSTVTGEWIDPSLATSPSYWARHLRSPVQFSKAIRVLLEDPARVVLECGPRRTSAALALQHRPARPGRVVASMPDSAEPDGEVPSLLLALGSLWLNGCEIDWSAFHEGETRRRRPLPTYPFQRRRFWIEPGNTTSFGVDGAHAGVTNGVAAAAEAALDVEAAHGPRPHGGRDETTAAVVTLLEELLGRELEDFDEDARFIALGLDSLLLTQLARGVRTRLGLEVTFRQLSERLSTTRLLADAIRASHPAQAPRSVPPASMAPAVLVRPAGVELTSSPAQHEMWRARLGGNEAQCAFNQSAVLSLKGNVDDEALARALRKLPDLHEALRGHFREKGERFVIEASVQPEVSRHDLSALPPEARDEAVRRLLERDATTAYDLERGPLFRAAVATLEPHHTVVLLGSHEAACDGWSLDVLMADLSRIYQGLVGASPPPAAPQHGLRDFVAYCSTPEYAAGIAASRTFWREAFERAPRRHAGSSAERSPSRSLASHRVTRLASADALSAVRALSRAESVSVFAILLSALATVLSRASGEADVVIGTAVAGHPDAGMEDCVGPLASLVPVRCRCDATQSFVELCRASQAAILDAREQAGPSPGELAAERGAAAPGAVFPVVFTHVQKLPAERLAFRGCTVDYHFSARAFERFPLGLTIVESKDALEISLQGSADLHGQEWLEQRIHELEALLEHQGKRPVEGTAVAPRRPYTTLLRDASVSLASAIKLRRCAAVGSGSRVIGRVWIHGEGRVVLGERVLLDGTHAPIELHPSAGAEIVISDDVVVEGGASIEATRAVRIGARTHVGAYCKIMDTHFHDVAGGYESVPPQPLVVEDDVDLGPHSILTAGAQVGRGTIVEARTVLGRSIGPGLVARGIPARIVRQRGTDAR
jgi:acyl transferase domain-containing protein/acetyltransferase-like isoleucine patch superfamily enzyme